MNSTQPRLRVHEATMQTYIGATSFSGHGGKLVTTMRLHDALFKSGQGDARRLIPSQPGSLVRRDRKNVARVASNTDPMACCLLPMLAVTPSYTYKIPSYA